MNIVPDLIAKYAVSGPRYTSYPTAAEFRPDFPAEKWPEMLRAEARGRAAAFYIHLPFCRSLCYFCACHKVVSASYGPAEQYLRALVAEMQLYSLLLGGDIMFDHLHLGGGTPNFLRPEDLKTLIDCFDEAFPYRTDDAERSIELDPRTVSSEHIRLLAYLGFTRVSCGVQDFDPAVQEAVNRRLTFDRMASLVESVRQAGIEDVNIDLIYGLPRQTLSGFARTLDLVIELRPERIALYGYAHLPNREKVQSSFRRHPLPDAQDRIFLLSSAIERLTTAGYIYIGMDHFALPSDPLYRASARGTLRRNFMGYTDRVSLPLIGLGASAISSASVAFVQNEKPIPQYERALLEESRLPLARGVLRSNDDRLRGEVIESVLCRQFLDCRELSARWNIDFNEYFTNSFSELTELERDGLITWSGDRLEVTPQGRFFLRNIAMAFDSYLPAHRSTRTPTFSQAV